MISISMYLFFPLFFHIICLSPLMEKSRTTFCRTRICCPEPCPKPRTNQNGVKIEKVI
ncbi:hypothetical protein Lalb_Chr05g0221831 [Lupinus albus]|uniref:Uncharacterized protein n=1 Tax=Lupinus albus TaxID=3870 RepID=A0A6A4QHG6_LUPAL|nr:hypothetical protein Lalb_Chr05g0221831 [Lupinus albus]